MVVSWLGYMPCLSLPMLINFFFIFSHPLSFISGGGYLKRFSSKGTCHYLGEIFSESAKLSVSFFETCAEIWVPFEETCRIMGMV